VHIFSHWKIKGYGAHISQQGNLEAHTSTLKSSSRIHLLPRKYRIHFQSQTSIQCRVLQFLHYLFSQWIVTSSLFQDTLLMCFWFHLEIIMIKQIHSPTFPSLLHSPLGNLVTPFHVVTHLPSSTTSPSLLHNPSGNPSLDKVSSHWKIQKPGRIPTAKQSYLS